MEKPFTGFQGVAVPTGPSVWSSPSSRGACCMAPAFTAGDSVRFLPHQPPPVESTTHGRGGSRVITRVAWLPCHPARIGALSEQVLRLERFCPRRDDSCHVLVV